MKHIDKKLLGIAVVGLSAWALVIALVCNNTTMAMLTNDPTPSGGQAQITSTEAQPRTLGATTESAAPDAGEIQGSSISQAPASNFAQAGNQDLTSELETTTTPKSAKLLMPIALIAAVFLMGGAALWFFAARQKPTSDK